MPRQATAAFALLSIVLAACGPEPVTGRPPPNPPGAPAVSAPEGRDAGSRATAAAAPSADAGRDASAASSDAPVPSGDAPVTGADAHPADAEAAGGSDAHVDATLDLPTDRAADASLDVLSKDASTNADGGADATADAAIAPGARAPGVGDVVIDEILANPTGSDLGREWIEIQSRADEPLDLSSLHVADTTTDVAVPAGALGAHALIVLGQSADPTKNGGAPVAAPYGTRLILNNEGEQVSLCLGACATGVVLDSVTWGAIGSAYDGHALVIDPTTKAICPAADPFGTAGDFGTPAAPNPPCAQPEAGAADGRTAIDAAFD